VLVFVRDTADIATMNVQQQVGDNKTQSECIPFKREINSLHKKVKLKGLMYTRHEKIQVKRNQPKCLQKSLLQRASFKQPAVRNSRKSGAKNLLIALMMVAASTSETSANFYQTTRCYNLEDSHLHTHHCENLKSYLDYI
jgi:hypothetical protein